MVAYITILLYASFDHGTYIEMFEIVFYTGARGDSPVRTFLDKLPPRAQHKAAALIDLLSSRGPLLHRPHADAVQGSLRELRVISGRQHYRILYAFILKTRILLLHGFHKKTDRLPAGEIQAALNRLKEFTERHEKGEIEL